MRAFEITPLMQEIADLIESGQTGDELDAKVALLVSEGPKAINDWIYSIKELEGQVVSLKERISSLNDRKASKEQAIERMRNTLQDVVSGAFAGKVKTDEFTASVSNRPKVKIQLREGRKITDLPTAFYKIDYSLNTQAIKAAAKEGITSEAIEYLETTEPTLTIR